MSKVDNRLLIYEKINQLIAYSKNLLNKYPKSERFDLCSDIKNSLYKTLKNVIFAWKTTDTNDKIKALKQIDIEIVFLKSLVRISYSFKYITEKNFAVWSEKLSEIGRMVGGWLKTCQKE